MIVVTLSPAIPPRPFVLYLRVIRRYIQKIRYEWARKPSRGFLLIFGVLAMLLWTAPGPWRLIDKTKCGK
jgi:hypothetical protein